MNDGKNELEQLVQENLKSVEQLPRDSNVIIRRVCCIKINPNWKFPNQMISAILIMLIVSVCLILTLVLPVQQSLHNILVNIERRQTSLTHLSDLSSSLTATIEREIQFASSIASQITTLLDYNPVSSHSPYLLQASPSKAVEIDKENLFTQYLSQGSPKEQLQWGSNYATLRYLGMTKQFHGQIWQPGNLLLSHPANTELFNEKRKDELLRQEWFKKFPLQQAGSNIGEIKLVNKSLSLVAASYDKHKALKAVSNIQLDLDKLKTQLQYPYQVFVTDNQGQILNPSNIHSDSIKSFFYDTLQTGFNLADWKTIVQVARNKEDEKHSDTCGLGNVNGSAICLPQIFGKQQLPKVIHIRHSKIKMDSYLEFDFYVLISVDRYFFDLELTLAQQFFSTLASAGQIQFALVLIIASIFCIIVMYIIILCIMRPFRQIVRFTDQYVDESKNKKKINNRSLQLSEISGAGLAGQLIDAYKRLLEGRQGLRGNKNEICERIQNQQYPKKIMDQDSLVGWKEQLNQIPNLNFSEEVVQQFSKEHKFNHREYKLQIRKLKQSGKESYEFYLRYHKDKLANHLEAKIPSQCLQEAILKMIVFDSPDQQKKQLLLQ